MNWNWMKTAGRLSRTYWQLCDWSELRGGLAESDLERMMAEATKKRYELGGGRIRALYGHSLLGRLNKSPAKPPDVLYHGTAPQTLPQIRQGGLLRRPYVHLSIDTGMATEVGRRKAQTPVVLRILASEAHAADVRFYTGNDKVWLADSVPAQFIVEPESSYA